MARQFSTATRGVEFFSMTTALKQFRQLLEQDAGASIDSVQVNAAELLDDLAAHIGLGEERRADVLGQRGATHVAMMKATRVSITVKH